MFMCTCEKCESIERGGRKGERERERVRERNQFDFPLSLYDRFFREAFGIAAEDYLVRQYDVRFSIIYANWKVYIVHVPSTYHSSALQ